MRWISGWHLHFYFHVYLSSSLSFQVSPGRSGCQSWARICRRLTKLSLVCTVLDRPAVFGLLKALAENSVLVRWEDIDVKQSEVWQSINIGKSDI